MSGGDSVSERQDCGVDAAAYALGALESAEAEAFRLHFRTCIVCRDELAAFQQVVDVLAVTPTQSSAPKALRRRVRRTVRVQPRRVVERGREQSRRPVLSWAFLPRPALALVALFAVLAAGVGGVELSSNGASSTRVIQASVGSARLRVSGDRAELIVQDLPAPPAGRIYEVWLQRAHGAPSPTRALFSVTAAGSADVGIPGELRGVIQVMVTQEPAGGSRTLTSPAVIVARLS